MRQNLILKSFAIAGLAAVLWHSPAMADESAVKSREIFNKNSHCVVTVEVVQKSNGGGKSSAPREAKSAITGIVMDSTGLTVVALSSCDPSSMYRRLSEEYKIEIEITDTKIILEDGAELPAEIVLRDKDLDLAFIRPKAKLATPMTAVDFKQSTTVDMMDEVVALNRLKQAVGRAYSGSIERIAAIVKRPRTFYVPDSAASETTLGSPAFAMDGKFVGMFVMRAVSAAGVGNIRDCYSVIILPAEDIIKASAQAPEAKGDASEKDAAPKAAVETKPEAATPK